VIQYGWSWSPGENRTGPKSDLGSFIGGGTPNLRQDFQARIWSMYPEYMPDPNILICPSDPNVLLKDAKSINCIAVAKNIDCVDGRPDTSNGACTSGKCGMIQGADSSYAYLGWALDKLELTQDLNECVDCGQGLTVSSIQAIAGTPAGTIAPTQAAQPFEYFLNVWNSGATGGCVALIANIINMQDCINNAPDKDMSPVRVNSAGPSMNPPLTVNANYGNGATNTVFRLREGIERALITDVNNPGASAKSQSDLFIAYDITSTIASGFNHVPGGSNVLYLDGHVKFIRSPGPADSPLNRGFAQFAGAIGTN